MGNQNPLPPPDKIVETKQVETKISKVVGPGYWDLMHRSAYGVRSAEDRELVLKLIDKVAEIFPCPKCRGHFQDMIAEDPPSKLDPEYDESGNDISIFKWLWLTHNKVNFRLKKPVLESLQDAILKYAPSETCSGNCDD